jgi:hypothetical protein
MLEKIVSGGETGASQAGWRAAQAGGIAAGGWMRKGFLTDDGCRPEFADHCAAAELPTASALACIEANVTSSDGTVWFGRTTTPAAHATATACLAQRRPFLPIYPGASFEPSHVALWIAENKIKTLNVTGNREHDEPGIGDHVERFMGAVLEQLGHERA